MARAASLAACTIDQIANSSTDARRVGDAVVGVTALGTWGVVPCRLHAELRFAVKPASDALKSGGTVAGIAGSPGYASVNVVVRPGDVFVWSWRWSNWCGARGRYVLQASWSAKAPASLVPSQAVRPPACTTRGSRSRLARVTAAVPGCTSADYTVTTGLGQPFEQALIPFVQLTPRTGSARPCLIRAWKVGFAVQGDAQGGRWATLGSIEGNPATRRVGAMLTANDGAAFLFWAWRNWCGALTTLRPAATVRGTTVVGPVSTQGPTCVDSTEPSLLTPSFGHA